MASVNAGMIAASVDSMARGSRSCVQISLKVANSIVAVAGIGIVLYSLWMIGVCFREKDDHRFYFSWFVCAFLAVGISFCVIACIGHAAANTRRGLCLSCYILLIFFILVAESFIIGDIFLNEDWKKDFPKDPSDRFDDFVDWVEDNCNAFKSMALLLAISQITSMIMAMILRTMRLHDYRSKFVVVDGHPYDKLPLLNHPAQPPAFVVAQAHHPQA
ncbi:hypothetical protein Nepgr_032190 [Nepenthes gracilis]|uniref:Tetraspanin-19 n=1 Tax=Nepenthes gracilis TaxID=150966 RepID=A0AAD3TKD6_NEPGR|nr:hypothetical protein Nepgr_032190 [Nepenthes gracilis]